MAVRSNSAAESAETEFVLTRVFDAPNASSCGKRSPSLSGLSNGGDREISKPRVHKLELRPGGVFLYSQRMPDGRDLWGKWVYREIVAPERLVIVNSFCDEKEHPVRQPV